MSFPCLSSDPHGDIFRGDWQAASHRCGAAKNVRAADWGRWGFKTVKKRPILRRFCCRGRRKTPKGVLRRTLWSRTSRKTEFLSPRTPGPAKPQAWSPRSIHNCATSALAQSSLRLKVFTCYRFVRLALTRHASRGIIEYAFVLRLARNSDTALVCFEAFFSRFCFQNVKKGFCKSFPKNGIGKTSNYKTDPFSTPFPWHTAPVVCSFFTRAGGAALTAAARPKGSPTPQPQHLKPLPL